MRRPPMDFAMFRKRMEAEDLPAGPAPIIIASYDWFFIHLVSRIFFGRQYLDNLSQRSTFEIGERVAPAI